jgi:hypothetical protein
MKFLLKLTTLTLLIASLGGCISINGGHDWDSNWENKQQANRKYISELSLGTQRSAVLMQLDTPSFSEAFVQEGGEYSVLFYRTHHVRSDGDTTRDETTPLVFENNKLMGWGHEMLTSLRD